MFRSMLASCGRYASGVLVSTDQPSRIFAQFGGYAAGKTAALAALPWSRNEGKFGGPTSGVPESRYVARVKSMPAHMAQRLADAERQGVVPVGAASILVRIDAAIEKLKSDGFGNATSIYLIEADLMALHEASGKPVDHFLGLPVSIGASSKVYSGRGSRAIRRAAKGSA
ncbi:hypothetical protein [Sphingomonas alpina]|uniref:Uncharacterized protein n=1 Tax=Sphingomonas alpina TaxID=653931 RepID=A0A7H0LHV7_9SPHN|nr:hypothetical protein [Sphingomonas alpina]QNQ09260.1 hypothetical protein H3Z74_21740 [Sphingomonas alpina]